MEEPSSVKGQRLRLTCTECYRRKIKCDKNIPCSTCVKRGHADLCTREDDNASTTGNMVGESESIVPDAGLVQNLIDRVNQLEAQLLSQAEGARDDCAVLQQPSTPIPRTPGQVGTSPSGDHTGPSPHPDPNSPGPEQVATIAHNDEDAATVLEFLAWGRSKDADYGTTSRQTSRFLLAQQDNDIAHNAIAEGSKHATLDLLETLLPSQIQIRELVSYHNTYILWYHGSYSSLTFDEDLREFLVNFHGDVRHPDADAQWLALLFAILTGSLACAPSGIRQSWGFQDSESLVLARHWYEASILCLNAGNYLERHSINAVEAIATLTIAAHILGRSNSQSILLSSAGRIAQSLGLHRLNADERSSKEQLRKKEAGRRVFNQLCTQDWFQIPFSESYSLNPHFISTRKPANCNDDDLESQPESVPTQASYCNYRYDIAALMPQLLDATSKCNTLFTKYEQVLKYDEKMRRLATESMPAFLSTSAVIAPNWPVWIGWGRRSIAICAAHKIIMIHRKFLGLSFTNTAFSFTRRTCVAAAKTILKEALSASDQNGPVLWIEQAFSVAAGIVLSLDIANKSPKQDDLDQHAALMKSTIGYLNSFKGSTMAARGALLLHNLQEAIERGAFHGLGKRQRDVGTTETLRPAKNARLSNVPRGEAHTQRTMRTMTNTASRFDGASEGMTWDTSTYPFPIDITLGPQDLFDDLLSLQF
ncbi:hypothetical protein C7974DRAFT_356858 [Boeremia exigua]|uniref:uncharacterized protein n=1 Tax=Boeremia exigua TaxID=749465 RepID=UPI001E8E221A|nr:uncharacterized protein C7974DRAFT_356858 [Boeremia exigua]KAH6638453.1 hypothetical protein C7974DRAFT_356858 [Boeremia exigua]